jgi:hypothetical protein
LLCCPPAPVGDAPPLSSLFGTLAFFPHSKYRILKQISVNIRNKRR